MSNRAAALKSSLRMKIENTSVDDVAREVFERIQMKTNMEIGKDGYLSSPPVDRVRHAVVDVLGLVLIEEWLEEIVDDYNTWHEHHPDEWEHDQKEVLPWEYPDEEEYDAFMDEIWDSLRDDLDELWGITYYNALEGFQDEFLEDVGEELAGGWQKIVDGGASS